MNLDEDISWLHKVTLVTIKQYHYELKNKDLIKLSSSTIYLQNQFKNGGQSANRLSRLRDINRDHYITSLSEKTVQIFYDKENNKSKVKHLIFCGPAQFKIEISENKLISSFFNNIHIINMADLDYDLLISTVDNFDDPGEKTIVDRIRQLIDMADEKLTFGNDIIQDLNACLLRTLYVHKDCKVIDNLKISYDVEIIKISSHMINQYGGIIGIKFY
jgi:hypothetical protein